MKKTGLLVWVLVSLLTGCDSSKPAKVLTCQDDPTGRSKEERMAIGDACFRGGSYKKSPPMAW